jgi:Protein of unknown function (DUF2971)
VFDFFARTILIPSEEDDEIRDKIQDTYTKIRGKHSPPDVLYHYTNPAGFCGIIESGRLRATHIAFMNDAAEYQHTIDLLAKITREHTPKSITEKQLLDRLIMELAKSEPDNFPPVFISCLSGVENSLNQWRAYGQGDGGISLGFDLPLLKKGVNKFRAYITPVIYCLDEQKTILRDLLNASISLFLTHTIKHKDDQDSYLEHWVTAFSIHIALLAPLMKDVAFSEEREWRIVYMPPYRTQVKFIPRPVVLSPYVELDIGEDNPHPTDWNKNEPALSKELPKRLPLHTVWIGPGRLSRLSNITVNTMLLNYAYQSVEIKISNITYRVVG